MELALSNYVNNNLEKKQNSFLQSTIGKAINTGLNLGIRFLLPNWAEDKVIELKDNLLNYGIKTGISKTVQSLIDVGKSAAGIVTGNFENINQMNAVVKNGGIIDSVSDLFDSALNKLRNSGKIDSNVYSIMKNGKNSILNTVENNIEEMWKEQVYSSRRMEKYISNWKGYYSNHDFNGMEKEYKKIKSEIRNLAPIENTINNARNIETLHKLIKNNGRNFDLTNEEIELANKLSL